MNRTNSNQFFSGNMRTSRADPHVELLLPGGVSARRQADPVEETTSGH